MRARVYPIRTYKGLLFLLFAMPWLLCAQSVRRFYPVDASDKGITYFLPQTRIVVTLIAEESRFEPGCYARYAGILLGERQN